MAKNSAADALGRDTDAASITPGAAAGFNQKMAAEMRLWSDRIAANLEPGRHFHHFDFSNPEARSAALTSGSSTR